MDSGASKASTVWRQVATVVWRQVATAGNTNHLLRPVAIRCQVVTIGCQAVDSGASNASTVWRQVATAGQVATCDLSSPKAPFRLTRSQRRGNFNKPPGMLRMGPKGRRAYRSLAAICSLGCFLCDLCAFAVRLTPPAPLSPSQSPGGERGPSGFGGVRLQSKRKNGR